VRVVGISLNTSQLSDIDAQKVLRETENKYGLPTTDPIRGWDLARIVDVLQNDFV
jgi:uncharacterized NAD-dependent epimerase/dehydratase family protein